MHVSDRLIDLGLSALDDATHIHVCSSEPGDFASVAGVSLGSAGVSVAAIADAAGGRQRTVSTQAGSTYTGGGSPAAYALVDTTNSRLLIALGFGAAKVVNAGDAINLADFTYTSPDAAPQAQNPASLRAILGTAAVIPRAGVNTASGLLAWGDVGDTGTLTDYGGTYSITASDATLEDQRFISTINQETSANNLTVRNCHFDLGNTQYAINNDYTQSPGTTLLVEDCTFEGTTSTQILIGGSGDKIFRRCRFRDARADFVKIFGSGDVLFEDCYFGGLSRTEYGAEDIHADVFQNDNSGTVTCRRCTWDNPPAVGGLEIPVTPGSWLEADGVAAGGTIGQIYYRASIGFFSFNNANGVNVFEDCFFKRMGSNGIQHDSAVESRLSNCSFYPTGIWNWRSGTGVFTDLGGNVWAETANDLQGIARTAGESIFA